MLTFEWDAAKARRNLAKHGVSFDDATRVFDDPFALMLQDSVEGGEERWQAIGRAGAHLALVVAHIARHLAGPTSFASFLHAARCGTRGDVMKTKRTKSPARKLATAPAKRSGARRAAVDTSDIPPLTEEFFAHAVRNPYYRPVKQSTTVRIDADVLAWLRRQGAGYQTRINAILRRAMLKDGKSA
jgi:uncharacterized DUF497 family protein/uncharacterized protein (DUF4415 family)